MHNSISRPTDDHGLGIGLRAFQQNQVGLDDLISALGVWRQEQGRSLEQILLDQGVLIPADCDRLSNGPSPTNEVLSTMPDLTGVAAPFASTLAFDPATHVSVPYPVRKGDPSRYQVVSLYAKGGLGEVFLAEDTEIRRQVALKKIHPQFAHDPRNLSRFLREAEITGSLEHPGVVPIYGLGITPDGAPFYAMRLIKGETLHEAIRRYHQGGKSGESKSDRRLALRLLLRRFQDICNAVAFAHSRGVIHRDLKPANIMLSDYGQTLVIDWGLARVTGSKDGSATDEERNVPVQPGETALTQMGSVVGTPAYMSPEQAAGRQDQLSPASDVYSLGATLFVLLTGRPPLEGTNLRDVLRKVELGEVPSPHQLDSEVPLPLNAICTKAMAFDPKDRYPAALDLAGEIEHWLADEPVSAYAEPFTARSARWARQHRPLVTGVAAATSVGILALALSTAWLATANRKLEEANTAEKTAKQEAQEQETKAKANFLLARESVNRYLKRASENRRLKDAGLAKLRKELLDEAGEFYKQFIRERTDDPTLETELSQAYLQAAKIETETGSAARAIERYQETREYIKKLEAAHPGDLTLQTDWAFCTVNLGLLSRSIDRIDDAGRYYQEALEKLEPLLATYPDNSALLNRLAGTYKSMASLYRAQSNYPAAIKSIESARGLFEQLTAAHPDNGAYADSLAGSWSNLGLMQRDQGNHQGAVASLRACARRSKKSGRTSSQ